MSDVRGINTVVSLAQDPMTDEAGKISMTEAKLIAAALLDGGDSIEGDGILQMHILLKSDSKFGAGVKKYLSDLVAEKSDLKRVDAGISDSDRLTTQYDAFDVLSGPKDEALKPLSKTKIEGLPSKVRSQIELYVRMVENDFEAEQSENDELTVNDINVFAMKNAEGKLLGYTIHGTAQWDTATMGKAIILAHDGKFLSTVDDTD